MTSGVDNHTQVDKRDFCFVKPIRSVYTHDQNESTEDFCCYQFANRVLIVFCWVGDVAVTLSAKFCPYCVRELGRLRHWNGDGDG